MLVQPSSGFPAGLIFPDLLVGAPGGDRTLFGGPSSRFLSCPSLRHPVLTTCVIPRAFPPSLGPLDHCLWGGGASKLPRPSLAPSPQTRNSVDPSVLAACPLTLRTVAWGYCPRNKDLPRPRGEEKVQRKGRRTRRTQLQEVALRPGEALPSEHLQTAFIGGRATCL